MVESLNGEQSNRKCERESGEKTSWDRSHRKPISYIIRLATATDWLLQPLTLPQTDPGGHHWDVARS